MSTAIYMTFVQADHRQRRLADDRLPHARTCKPFFGGTYFPPEDRYGLPGFRRCCSSPRRVGHAARRARQVRRRIDPSDRRQMQQLEPAEADAGGDGARSGAVGELAKRSFDPHARRLRRRAQFPGAGQPQLPLPLRRRSNDARSRRDMALHTLDAMAARRDPRPARRRVSPLLHRRAWFLPHFEKMLYDQRSSPAATSTPTRSPATRPTPTSPRDILDYVLRDLTGPDGQFLLRGRRRQRAAPRPSPKTKREGAFYVWRADEIEKRPRPEPAADLRIPLRRRRRRQRPRVRTRTGNSRPNVLSVAHTPEETAQAVQPDRRGR